MPADAMFPACSPAGAVTAMARRPYGRDDHSHSGPCDCRPGRRDPQRSPFGVCLCDNPSPYYANLCARCGLRLRPTVIY